MEVLTPIGTIRTKIIGNAQNDGELNSLHIEVEDDVCRVQYLLTAGLVTIVSHDMRLPHGGWTRFPKLSMPWSHMTVVLDAWRYEERLCRVLGTQRAGGMQ